MTESAKRAIARAENRKHEHLTLLRKRVAEKKALIAREAMEWNGAEASPVEHGEFRTGGYTAKEVA